MKTVSVGFLFFLSVKLFAAVAYGSTQTQDQKDLRREHRYTLQLVTLKTPQRAEKLINRLPQEFQEKTHIYKTGDYITLRYGNTADMEELKKQIDEFRQLGYPDAYIIKTTLWHLEHNRVDKKKEDEPPVSKTADKSLHIQTKLSKFVKSSLLIKADKAYRQGDESTALAYYEIVYQAGNESRQIKRNLCYLYGKRGALFEAKKIIQKERYISDLLYAYGYGALQSNQGDFVQDLAEEIMMDKSGRLALLAGYYYERKGDLFHASNYYKIAYNKNNADPYILYAYARSLDLQQDYDNALVYYELILRNAKTQQSLLDAVVRRVAQLKE